MSTDTIRHKLNRYKNVPVIFIHIDTTGISNDDELIRLTILADDTVAYDEIYFSLKPMNERASMVSGITNEQLQNSQICFIDEIASLKEMLKDKLVVCANEYFTKKYLRKAGLYLEDDNVIDIIKATNYLAAVTITQIFDVLKFYELNPYEKNTYNKNFLLYECACKLQIMAQVLLKDNV